MNVCMYKYMYVCMYVCMYVWTYLPMYVCMYVAGMVSFEFVEEVVVSKNMLLSRRGTINHMTMQVRVRFRLG